MKSCLILRTSENRPWLRARRRHERRGMAVCGHSGWERSIGRDSAKARESHRHQSGIRRRSYRSPWRWAPNGAPASVVWATRARSSTRPRTEAVTRGRTGLDLHEGLVLPAGHPRCASVCLKASSVQRPLVLPLVLTSPTSGLIYTRLLAFPSSGPSSSIPADEKRFLP